MAITISIFFILSMAAATSVIPNAKAQTGIGNLIPTTGQTYAFPKINGVGQTEYLLCWVTPAPLVAGQYYYNETMIITTPKGTVVTTVLPTSDVSGAGSLSYVNTEVGNYTLVMTWAGDSVKGAGATGHEGCH